jgi:hypothetical protein
MSQVIDRRGLLKITLGGVAAAAMGLALIPGSAEAEPLTMGAGHGTTAGNPVEKAVVVVRRRRVRRCWWRHGHRVCRWV